MDLLLCLVEANAAATNLARVAAQSLHAVDDCSFITECCTKVLPDALSALEGAALTNGNTLGQAVECVQGCNAAMVQLQIALENLNAHESEGVLGILLEHPAAWLDTYRAFRGLTMQLVGINNFVRAAAMRGQADDSDDALHDSVKALLGTCSRAREAANLLGSDLPEFARTAAAASWSPAERVRFALTNSGEAQPCRWCSGCRHRGTCSYCGSGSATAGAAMLTSITSAMLQKQDQQQASCPHQRQRVSLLRRIGNVAVCRSPDVQSGSAALDQSYSAGVNSVGAALQDAACALVARIQEAILHDSEVDQLEQDQAYLRQRVSHLQKACDSCTAAGAVAAAATIDTRAAAAALIQSELLLAAVDSQLRALRERRDSSTGETCRERLADSAVTDAALCAAAAAAADGAVVAHARIRVRAASSRLVDAELYDDDQKRRPVGLRWLPVCFVGA